MLRMAAYLQQELLILGHAVPTHISARHHSITDAASQVSVVHSIHAMPPASQHSPIQKH